MFNVLLESRWADAGKGANSVNTLTAGLTDSGLTVINVLLTVFPAESIATLTEVMLRGGGHLKVSVVSIDASGIILALVVLALIHINFTVLSCETLVTDTSICLRTIFKTRAMVEARIVQAGIMRHVTNRPTPASVTLTLEADVHC